MGQTATVIFSHLTAEGDDRGGGARTGNRVTGVTGGTYYHLHTTSSQVSPSRGFDFQLANFCALPLEYDAVHDSLDEVWKGPDGDYGKAPSNLNRYATGSLTLAPSNTRPTLRTWRPIAALDFLVVGLLFILIRLMRQSYRTRLKVWR